MAQGRSSQARQCSWRVVPAVAGRRGLLVLGYGGGFVRALLVIDILAERKRSFRSELTVHLQFEEPRAWLTHHAARFLGLRVIHGC